MNWYKIAQQKELALDDKTEEDAMYDYYDAERETVYNVLGEFKYSEPDTVQPWTVVPLGRVKKIWEDYMKMGFVRDEKGMDSISQQMIKNVHRLAANTYLMGHSNSDPSDDFSEYDIDESAQERFWDEYAIDEQGQARISDYGLKPLQELAFELQKTFNPEKQLQLVDKMLSICHQRSDLPSFFIEGGTSGLNQLFGRPTGMDSHFYGTI